MEEPRDEEPLDRDGLMDEPRELLLPREPVEIRELLPLELLLPREPL